MTGKIIAVWSILVACSVSTRLSEILREKGTYVRCLEGQEGGSEDYQPEV